MRRGGRRNQQQTSAPDFELIRASLAQEVPWLSRAIWALRGPYWRPGIGTAGVSSDGRVYVDPAVLQWKTSSIQAMLEHEVWHVVLDHAARANRVGVTRATHLTWNGAADCEIHSGSIRPGSLDTLRAEIKPDKPIEPRTFDLPEGLSAEEYYYMLMDSDNANKQTSLASGSGADGVPRDYEGADAADGDLADVPGWTWGEAESIRREVASAILDQSSRCRGVVPAGALRWAEKHLGPPVVDWRTLLRQSLQGTLSKPGMSDFTYSRPSRRDPAALRGYVSPGTCRRQATVALVVDTSGSVSNKMLGLALREVTGIARAVGGEVWAAACDSATSKFRRIRRPEDISLLGGGGTDMRRGILDALTVRPRPKVVVVATDGETPWPTVSDMPSGMSLIALLLGDKATRPPDSIEAIHVSE